jgi:hypothetical protein
MRSPEQTVWSPKDFLLFVVVMIPVWGLGGLAWGLVMALLVGGWLPGWLLAGLLWGAAVWVIFSILILITCRELSTTIPLPEAATFPERLAEAARSLRYLVEQQSPTHFVCKPRYGLVRLFSFQFTRLHVRLRDGSVDLVGPAAAVKKVRKKFEASSPTPAIPIR